MADYVGARRRAGPPDVMPVPRRPGWYRLADTQFRLPTAGDQAAVAGRVDAARALAERCLDPPRPGARLRARVERGDGGRHGRRRCRAPISEAPVPNAARGIESLIHVARLVVSEISRDAASLHDDVDLIARAYHWPEADILRLPSAAPPEPTPSASATAAQWAA